MTESTPATPVGSGGVASDASWRTMNVYVVFTAIVVCSQLCWALVHELAAVITNFAVQELSVALTLAGKRPDVPGPQLQSVDPLHPFATPHSWLPIAGKKVPL